MTTEREWTDWIPHIAGDPCPIPDAKAGEYQLRFADGEFDESPSKTAMWWGIVEHKGDIDCWGLAAPEVLRITHYRLLKPAVDWKAIAEKQNEIIERLAEELRLIRMKDSGAVYDTLIRIDAQIALTRYREATK